MAKYLLDVVRNGIGYSHEISDTCHDTIYDNGVLPKLQTKALAQIVLDRLKVMDCGIKEIIVNKYSRFPSNSICGVLLNNGGKANIYVNSNRTECWQRFTICKELLQLYIDCTSVPSTTSLYNGSQIVKQITELVDAQDKLIAEATSATGLNNVSDPFPENVTTEMEAIVTAMDLVFAKRYKKEILNEIPSILSNRELRPYDIANIMKMPEFVVTTYYRSFHNISTSLMI